MGAQFIKSDSPDVVVEAVVKAVKEQLAAGKRVIWLVSGGSLIAAEAAVMEQLSEVDCANLAIFQADERYGDVGHKDSNWQQLLDAGFDAGSAYAVPVLAALPFEQTVQRYDTILRAAFNADGVSIVGFFGIGVDGHTAGILPGSEAVQPTVAFVTGYQAADFRRITLTPTALARVDKAVAYAAGKAKTPALQQLFRTEASPVEQPAQLLKTAKQTAIYNDSLDGQA